ncbi:hypothetical protein B7463_g255, partial [Scytalidium lignicola]
MATEIYYLKLKPGVNVEEGEAAKQWKEAMRILASPEGLISSSWGLQYENPQILMGIVNWASLEDHEKFSKSETHSTFVGILGTIIERPYLHHFQPTSPIDSLVSTAPCVEVATFYDIPPNFLVNIKAFAEALANGKVPGFIGYTYGPAIEEIAPYEKVFEEGAEKKKAAVLLITWESKEKHIEFTQSELYKEKVPLLIGAKGFEIFHVSFKSG